jgi:hypothetical protein
MSFDVQVFLLEYECAYGREGKCHRYLYIKSCLQSSTCRGYESVSRHVRFAFHNALRHQRAYGSFV